MIDASKVLHKAGIMLAVIRPQDSEMALELAKSIIGRPDGERAMQEILEAQAYTFVGLASIDGRRLLHPETGEDVGAIQPGDSFVSWPDFCRKMN